MKPSDQHHWVQCYFCNLDHFHLILSDQGKSLKESSTSKPISFKQTIAQLTRNHILEPQTNIIGRKDNKSFHIILSVLITSIIKLSPKIKKTNHLCARIQWYHKDKFLIS